MEQKCQTVTLTNRLENNSLLLNFHLNITVLDAVNLHVNIYFDFLKANSHGRENLDV